MRFTTACLILLLSAPVLAEQPSEAKALPAISPGPAIGLAEALELADNRNRSLMASRTDLEKARADLKYAWSLLLPTASGSLSFTHNDHADTVNVGGQPITVRKQDSLTTNLQVNLPLVNARAWLGVSSARQGKEVSALGVEAARQALLLTVAQTYFAALAAKSLVEVQHTQIRSTERHLAVASIRHRSGTGPRVDVVRAKTELIRGREELTNAVALLDNTRDALATLLDMEGLPMPVEVAPPAPPPEEETELFELAANQREDLKLNQALVELADRNLTGSWMNFVPSLNASWQLNQQVTDPSDFSDSDQSRWFIGLTLQVPIYDHTRYAELDQFRAALARVDLETQDATQKAHLEIRQAKRNWQTAAALVATAEEKVALARETYELSASAYQSGSGNSLEVTDAQRTSRQADIDLATKRFDAQLSLLNLLRAVGQDMSKLSSQESS